MGFQRKRSRSARPRPARSQRSARQEKNTTRAVTYLFIVVRILQLVAAVVAIGYYASDLHKAKDKLPVKYNQVTWVYTVVVLAMAAISALVLIGLSFFATFIITAVVFVWEWILVILLSAVTGLMCHKYYRHKPEQAHDWHSMRIATGFVCASLALWFITAVLGSVRAGFSLKDRGRSAA